MNEIIYISAVPHRKLVYIITHTLLYYTAIPETVLQLSPRISANKAFIFKVIT